MTNIIIYMFPLLLDIIVSLSMFILRHSFAESNMDEKFIGLVALIYGLVYIISSILMGRIIKPALAKMQIIISLGIMCVLMLILALIKTPLLTLIIFAGVPAAASMFFNAFQSFLLKLENHADKHLSLTAGHYTFAWSVGFALGPFITAIIKKYSNWQATYYFAAFITLVLATVIVFIKQPVSKAAPVTKSVPVAKHTGKSDPPLPFSGWLGVLIALVGWVIISIYWPVQAKKLDLGITIKGSVEFIFAITQAFSALVICIFLRWYHKPKLLPLLGLSGIVSLILFAFAASPVLFIAGAFFYGIYTGSCFTYMVYHAMLDEKKAVKRVAVNEFIVGASYLTGPLIASLFISMLHSYKYAYLAVLVFIACGVLVQTFIAAGLMHMHRKKLKPLEEVS